MSAASETGSIPSNTRDRALPTGSTGSALSGRQHARVTIDLVGTFSQIQ